MYWRELFPKKLFKHYLIFVKSNLKNNPIFWKLLFWTWYHFFDKTLEWISFKYKFSRHNQVFIHILFVFIYYSVAHVMELNSTIQIFIASPLQRKLVCVRDVKYFRLREPKVLFHDNTRLLSDHFLVRRKFISISVSRMSSKNLSFFLSIYVYYCNEHFEIHVTWRNINTFKELLHTNAPRDLLMKICKFRFHFFSFRAVHSKLRLLLRYECLDCQFREVNGEFAYKTCMKTGKCHECRDIFCDELKPWAHVTT